MPITIRNINKETDVDNFVEFLNLAHADYPDHKDATKEYVQEYIFGDKDFDEKLNFLAFDGNRLIGRGRGDYETKVDGFVTLQIIPEYRSEKIMDMLYDIVIKQLASRKLATIRTMVYGKFPHQIHYFEEKEYKEKIKLFSMKRDMKNPVPKIDIPNMIISVPDLKKEYQEVRDTIDIGFSDTMNSTEEMMMNYDNLLKEDYFLDDGIIIARDENNNMLGACVAAIHPAMKDTGHIPWLAVLKEHRRKGLGKALLCSSLVWLEKKKIKTTNLSVEVSNPNALKLYNNCGFEVKSEMNFMEKKLD